MAQPLLTLTAEWELIDEQGDIICARIVVRAEDEILSDVIALIDETGWHSC